MRLHTLRRWSHEQQEIQPFSTEVRERAARGSRCCGQGANCAVPSHRRQRPAHAGACPLRSPLAWKLFLKRPVDYVAMLVRAGQCLGFGDGCGVVRCLVRRQPSVFGPDLSVSRPELRSDHQKRRHRQQKDPQPRVKPSLGQAPGEAVSDPKGEKTHHYTCEQQGQTKGHGRHNRQ